jgi:hypothetical protein
LDTNVSAVLFVSAAGLWPTDEKSVHHTGGQLPGRYVAVLLERLDIREDSDWYAATALVEGWKRGVLVHFRLEDRSSAAIQVYWYSEFRPWVLGPRHHASTGSQLAVAESAKPTNNGRVSMAPRRHTRRLVELGIAVLAAALIAGCATRPDGDSQPGYGYGPAEAAPAAFAGSEPDRAVLKAIESYLDVEEELIEDGQVGLRDPDDAVVTAEPIGFDPADQSLVTVGEVDAEYSEGEVVATSGSSTTVKATVTLEFEFLDPALPEPVIGSMTDEYLITVERAGGAAEVSSVELIEAQAERAAPKPPGRSLPPPASTERAGAQSAGGASNAVYLTEASTVQEVAVAPVARKKKGSYQPKIDTKKFVTIQGPLSG